LSGPDFASALKTVMIYDWPASTSIQLGAAGRIIRIEAGFLHLLDRLETEQFLKGRDISPPFNGDRAFAWLHETTTPRNRQRNLTCQGPAPTFFRNDSGFGEYARDAD
jgi:hypothetical protein